MIDGSVIILLSLAALFAFVIWLLFRIRSYRRRIREIENLAGEISTMGPSSGARVGDTSPILPESDILIIFNRGTREPWKRRFNTSVSKGLKGMVISTHEPRKVRSQYPGDIMIVWLNRSTAVGREKDVALVNPTNLPGLIDEVESHLIDNGIGGIVLLDGFEDILRYNDPDRVIRFLQSLRDRCSRGKISVVAPMNYRAVPQRVRNQLSESFETVVI